MLSKILDAVSGGILLFFIFTHEWVLNDVTVFIYGAVLGMFLMDFIDYLKQKNEF